MESCRLHGSLDDCCSSDLEGCDLQISIVACCDYFCALSKVMRLFRYLLHLKAGDASKDCYEMHQGWPLSTEQHSSSHMKSLDASLGETDRQSYHSSCWLRVSSSEDAVDASNFEIVALFDQGSWSRHQKLTACLSVSGMAALSLRRHMTGLSAAVSACHPGSRRANCGIQLSCELTHACLRWPCLHFLKWHRQS